MANQVVTIAFMRYIQENLFRGAEFLKYALSHDAFVKDNSVEIPQAGTIPDVSMDQGNPTLPLPVNTREDDKRSYNLNNFRVGAILVERSEELETSYPKASSVIKNSVDKLNQEVGDYGAFEWSIDPTEFSDIL